jgi:tubulin polyglutamylase TTLL5
MKPIGMSRGRGISLIKDLNDVIFSEPVVIQKYLKNPLLLDGYKFDMRIYVLLSSINPL